MHKIFTACCLILYCLLVVCMKYAPLYQSLSLTNSEIRLIIIDPSLEHGLVECSLITVSLHENPVFEALSYAWGSPTSTRSILLEGREFDVTTNLESALRHLRLPDKKRLIWIDALCINQQDIQERNHQVRLMRHIYVRASRATIWLGPEAEESNLAMELFKILSSAEDLHIGQQMEPYLHPKYLSLTYVDATVRLLGREWWHRVWTVQEVILPEEFLFVCGNRVVDGDTIWLASDNFLRHAVSCCSRWYIANEPKGIMALVNALDTVCQLGEARSRRSQTNVIVNIIAAFRKRRCSDPRDKVYGFLGLVSGEWLNFLIPDYGLTVEKVLEAAAWEFMIRLNSLRIFGFIERSTSKSLQLASWIPTWNAPEDDYSHKAAAHRRSLRPYYKASGSRPLEVFRVHPGIISLKGVAVDCVSITGSPQLYRLQAAYSTTKTFEEWRSLAIKIKHTVYGKSCLAIRCILDDVV